MECGETVVTGEICFDLCVEVWQYLGELLTNLVIVI